MLRTNNTVGYSLVFASALHNSYSVKILSNKIGPFLVCSDDCLTPRHLAMTLLEYGFLFFVSRIETYAF